MDETEDLFQKHMDEFYKKEAEENAGKFIVLDRRPSDFKTTLCGTRHTHWVAPGQPWVRGNDVIIRQIAINYVHHYKACCPECKRMVGPIPHASIESWNLDHKNMLELKSRYLPCYWFPNLNYQEPEFEENIEL